MPCIKKANDDQTCNPSAKADGKWTCILFYIYILYKPVIKKILLHGSPCSEEFPIFET